MAQTTTATDPYNLTASPQSGSGAYGSVPGAIGIPPNTFQQVGAVYPGLSDQAGQMSSNVNNELMGQLSPETIAQLQQHAAQFGISSGMPGSQFQGNQGLTQLGLNVEGVQRQGQQDYLSALAGIGNTQTPQSLAADIANRNSTLAAAPNPQEAAAQQMQDWQTKFNATQGAGAGGGSRGPAGGTMGGASNPAAGTGTFNPASGGGAASPSSPRAYTDSRGQTWQLGSDGLYHNPQTGASQPANTYTDQNASYYDPLGVMGTFGGDAYTPPNTYTDQNYSYYDPTGTMGTFDQGAGAYDYGSYTPPDTYTTDTSSYYDPFGTSGTFDTSSGGDYSMFSPDTGGYYSDYWGEG